MQSPNRTALTALATAGVLWGMSIPLSKLSLAWLSPEWLAAIRFAAAVPPLAILGRRGLRGALTPTVALNGVVGFGLVILLQNAGVARTSVSHAAVIVGVVPMLVALIGLGLRSGRTSALAWAGYGLALLGVALVAGSSGGGASNSGDLLVLVSAALSAATIVVQPRVLAGRDAAAVTAVQFAASALAALPVALLTGSTPSAPTSAGPVLALIGVIVGGTVLPFWLFARGQAHVPAQLAGAFVNLEPLVGAIIGWLAFGNHAGPLQFAGALAVVAGVVASALPAETAQTLWWRVADLAGDR